MKIIQQCIVAGLAGCGLSALAAQVDLGKLPPASTQTGVTYAKEIQPIFETTCVRCHGEKQHKGGIRLDSLEAVLKGGDDGKIVTVGDSTKSQIVIAVSQLDPKTAMPPKPRARRKPGGPQGTNAPAGDMGEHHGGPGPGGPDGPPPGGPDGPGGPPPGRPMPPPPKPLTAEQVGLIRAWIDQGAN